jgi:hypothetical protein
MKTDRAAAGWITPRPVFGLAVILGLLLSFNGFSLLEAWPVSRPWPVLLGD